jgi:glycosyltransferase involved in cell wall biosynthesis
MSYAMAEHTQSKGPFFSIITASFNRHSTLKETLDSVASQRFRNYEHIVIDGGSNDGTVDLLKKYQGCGQLKWLSESDEGISDALNKGMRLSEGRYIFVLQADDSFIDQNCLNMAYKYIIRHLTDIFSFPVILKESSGKERIIKPIRLIWYNHFKFILHHQGCFIYEKVFKSLGGYRNRFKISMDYDFMYRALKSGATVEFGHFPVAKMSGGGISSFVYHRVQEDRQVQLLNEDDPLWRIAQMIFYALYFPYKRFQYYSMRKTS